MPTRYSRWIRDPALCARDLERHRERHPEVFPVAVRDLVHGERRLAAEVSLAVMRFEMVPSAARERAITILTIMAND